MSIYIKYLIAWFPMVFIAILNGSLRQYTYGTTMIELTAHQISTITAIILFGIYINFISKKWKLNSAKQTWHVGLIWLILI